MKLSFGTGEEANPPSPSTSSGIAGSASRSAGGSCGRQTPDRSAGGRPRLLHSRLVDADEGEFRVVFNRRHGRMKFCSSALVMDKKMTILDPAKIPSATDHCVWRPDSVGLVSRVLGKEPDKDVAYTLTATDGTRQSPASLAFDMRFIPNPASAHFDAFCADGIRRGSVCKSLDRCCRHPIGDRDQTLRNRPILGNPRLMYDYCKWIEPSC